MFEVYSTNTNSVTKIEQEAIFYYTYSRSVSKSENEVIVYVIVSRSVINSENEVFCYFIVKMFFANYSLTPNQRLKDACQKLSGKVEDVFQRPNRKKKTLLSQSGIYFD